MFNKYKFRKYNFRIIIYAMFLSLIGVLLINSATFDEKMVKRQIFGLIVGFVFMLLASLISYKIIIKYSILFYILSVAVLLLVLFKGYRPEGSGATRWLELPIVGRVQPSEFVKLALIIFSAWFLSKDSRIVNSLSNIFIYSIAVGIIFVLVLLEPDLSTTVMLFMICFSIIFVAGIRYIWILIASFSLLVLSSLFIWIAKLGKIPFFKEYQANRIIAWLNPDKFENLNFQQANSIMAIGSGQLQGKGINNTAIISVKNGNFVSQDQTDFIFAIIGEELGFIGSVFIIFVIALLVFEILYLASKAKDKDGSLICIGVASLIMFQSFTNIAVATGVFPNTGLPLPFISYGMSSLISIYISLGLVLNVGLYKK